MSEVTAIEHSLMGDGALPCVTFDVRMGREFSNVEFDYNAYNQLARSMGASDEQITTFDLHFAYGGPLSLHSQTGTCMSIKMNQRSDSKVNKWIAHETWHAVDEVNGNISPSERAQSVATNVLRLGAPVLAAADVVLSFVGIISHDTQLGTPLLSIGAAAVGSLLTAKALYVINGSERRARQAAKGERPLVLRTTRRI